ncbi:hypothetical protein DFS34DRAFT_589564 [Phlyctochytrium arcticum]|nr:hypothetical protein DFS34DRAFT_589564 [Phlyctochytrium arcticum]
MPHSEEICLKISADAQGPHIKFTSSLSGKMTSTPDFAALLPLKLEADLKNLTKIYGTDSLPALNKAFFGLFPGIPGPTPNIVEIKSLFLDACQDALPAIRDLSTYALVFPQTITALGNDKDAIAYSMRAIVSGWKAIDFQKLTDSQEKIYLLIEAYPHAADIINHLNAFVGELKLPQTSDVHPPYYQQSIFEIVAPIMAPIATFSDSVSGKALLADLLDLTVDNVTQPLERVFHPPPSTKAPNVTPEMVANAITRRLISPIQSYEGTLQDIITDFGAMVNILSAVSGGMTAVSRGIEQFGQGEQSTSTAQPVTAKEAAAAWTAVGPAADAFVNLVASGRGSSGSTTLSARAVAKPSLLKAAKQQVFSEKKSERPHAMMAAAPSPNVSITVKDVTSAFGAPPAYSAETLPEMTATTGKIAANFTKIMTLPFIEYVPSNCVFTLTYVVSSQLKVTGADAKETSLSAVMLGCKTKYEALQLKTIPIVRDLHSYSVLQQTILPAVGKDMTLTDFLQSNMWIVMKYGASAKQIAKDTRALLSEFQGFHEMLMKNLDEIKKSIAANQKALEQAQAQFDSLLAKTIIEGLVALICTVGAIAALLAGVGPLAATLAVTAGTNFAMMISDAVSTGKLAGVIGSLKGIIASSTTTADQLKQVIPIFQTIIDLMSQIGDIWDSIDGSLTSIQQEYTLWNNPSYFTATMVVDAVASWLNVQNQCMAYIQMASDTPPPPASLNLLSAHFKNMSMAIGTPLAKKARAAPARAFLTAAALDVAPPPYDPHSDPIAKRFFSPATPADRVWKFRTLVTAEQDGTLLAALKAPELSLICNRAQLDASAAQYGVAATIITASGIQSMGNDLKNLSATLTNNLIPALNQAVAFYVKFAAGQKDPFTQPLTQETLAAIISSRSSQLTNGSNLAKAAESIFIQFQGLSQMALNNLIAQMSAQKSQLDIKNQSLNDRKNELAKYDWVKWVPGIGAIIDAIVSAIKGDQDAINSLNREISSLNIAQAQVTAAIASTAPCRELTSTLSGGWSTLTTQTQQLQTFQNILEKNPTRDATFRPLVQSSWATLSSNLAKW